MLFSIVAALIYILISNAPRVPFSPHPHLHWLLLTFYIYIYIYKIGILCF